MNSAQNSKNIFLLEKITENLPRILLIQKKQELLCFYQKVLIQIGYDVVSSVNANIAFTTLERDKKIEMVIFDGFLPENSGLQLLTKIRKKTRYEWTPVLMTLDHGDQRLVSNAIKSGVNGILLSPCTIESLKEKINLAKEKGRKSVLIVDDDSFILEILKNVVELERFKVFTASSAEMALEILSENHIDVIISDIIMPGGMSGVDLLKKVKRINQNLPILMITGGGHTYTTDDLTKAGADGFFRKPFHNIELVKKIRDVIHRSLKFD